MYWTGRFFNEDLPELPKRSPQNRWLVDPPAAKNEAASAFMEDIAGPFVNDIGSRWYNESNFIEKVAITPEK